ncbi:MAG: ATPase, T2SS/T4P/T4SS family, partial [Sedimentisphaerales bacterium]|nr:ATPase, T2SS/T4P/T4SS family [Sedimentisphaerales bacterium]
MATQYDFGPLQKLINDPDVSEIMVNGPKKVFVERDGKKTFTDVSFRDKEELEKIIYGVLATTGKRPDEDRPYADACLDDGTRINIILPPVVRAGISVTIRKFSEKIKTLEDLVKIGTLPQNAADFLIACIKGKLNIIFSGGTGVGKTTTLQLLSAYFAPEERIVTVEDTAELRFNHPNLVALETKDKNANG